VGFGAFLILTVVVEAGLAYSRATILIGGEARVSGSFVDHVMVAWGPWLVGAIGVIVPVAHTALGFMGFSGFIEPVIGYPFRCLRAIALLAWAALTYALLGFHDEPPALLPRWADDLVKAAAMLAGGAKSLRAATCALRERQQALERSENLLAATVSPVDLDLRVQALASQKNGLEATWKDECRALRERARAAVRRADLEDLIQLTIDVPGRAHRVAVDADNVRAVIEKLSSDVAAARRRPKLIADGQTHRQRLGEQLRDTRARQEQLDERVLSLTTTQREILGIWSGGPPVLSTLAGLEPQIAQVKTLSESLPALSRESTEAKTVFGHCHSLVSKSLAEVLVSARSASAGAHRAACDATRALAAAAEPAASAAPASAVALADLQRRAKELACVIAVAQRHSVELAALAKRVAARRREIERRPAWFWWLMNLIGGTSGTDL
jgi:hypothetical protein